ncbi:MAG: PP2C family protein-serine/threonine phosphatase [Phycisphaerae bacterium]|nr:PP2C family protein-serine/threonine phosphatase [Phycisphaerae bacterium]
MAQPSYTSRDSFLLRVQRSELTRLALIAGMFAAMLLIVLVRRVLQGAVMAENSVFYPTAIVLSLGLAYQVYAFRETRRCIAEGKIRAAWRWWAGAAVDLAVPIAALLILHLNAPHGAIAALSAPAILIVPLVILLSVLRLKPWFSFWTGAAAAAGHWALVTDSVLRHEIDPNQYPLLYTYGVGLLMIGVAGAMVAKHVKRYVIETLDEAAAAERARQSLANVERDLAVARDIQRGLLPSTAAPLDGFDIAGMNRPADQTGGDYYDWQPLPDGRLAVVLADVTGHGIGPALVMAVCRAYSRAAAPAAPTPGALLERLNSLIHDDLQGARFITMVLALVAPDGSVQLASAGHGPTLLYTAKTGEVEWFGGDGLPLGVMPDERYAEQRTFTLAPGDVLVLQTDGFIEWARTSDNKQFGLDRMKDALRRSAGGNARSIIESIDRAVIEFSEGSPQADDMTAVAIKRL